jgi:hypothetical protein
MHLNRVTETYERQEEGCPEMFGEGEVHNHCVVKEGHRNRITIRSFTLTQAVTS